MSDILVEYVKETLTELKWKGFGPDMNDSWLVKLYKKVYGKEAQDISSADATKLTKLVEEWISDYQLLHQRLSRQQKMEIAKYAAKVYGKLLKEYPHNENVVLSKTISALDRKFG